MARSNFRFGSIHYFLSSVLLLVTALSEYGVGVGGGFFLFVGAIECNISVGELDALEALYYSTNGSNWNWRTADDDNFSYEPYENGTSIWEFPANVSDPCSNNWQGITCVNNNATYLSSSSCFIDTLELVNYNLKGTLPSNISSLTGLTYIDLRFNYITSSVPNELYTMTSMTYLRLYSNQLSGSISCNISSMTKLTKISISRNLFTGSICKDLTSLKNLYFLGLFQNSLTGTIPKDLSLMTSLVDLFLYSNSLTGVIPSQLSTLSLLDYLYLNNNYLSSSIPSQLSTLSQLLILELQSNYLTSSIPSELSALSRLNFLELDENFLSFAIPNELTTLLQLNYLYLENNYFSSSISSGLSALSKLIYFDVSYNLLTSTLPSELGNLTSLQFLFLNNNKFTGSIPSSFSAISNLTLLYLQDNSLTNSIPAHMFSEIRGLQVLDMSNNHFEGHFPPSLSMLRSTLIYIAASNNKFTGDPFFFLGFSHIQLVNVSYNRFDDTSKLKFATSSTFRTKISTCYALTYLDISNNYLTGSLPDSIGTVIPHLKLLSVSNNRLLPYVPESLCHLKNLSTLLLSGLGNRSSSSLITSSFAHKHRRYYSIPSCLLSLPLLETAHLVSNALYGTIGEIGPNIASLSLVGNLLTGTIPNSIQTSSSKLTFLQLSINRLSGTLVDNAFVSLEAKSSIIDLYSNRISGDIPNSLSNFGKGNNYKPNMLTGNVFNCRYGDAPSNLVDYQTYSCGSSSIDFYLYVYLGIGIALMLFIVSFFIWIRRRRADRSNDNSASSSTNGKKRNKSALEFFIIYFQHRPFPTSLLSCLVSSQFISACIVVALFMTLFNVGYTTHEKRSDLGSDYLSKRTFVTVFDRYGWTSAFIYVHGVLPFSLIALGLCTLLFVYLYWFNRVGGIISSKTISSSASSNSNHISNGVGKKQLGFLSDPLLYCRSLVSSLYAKCASFCKECSSAVSSFADSKPKRQILALQVVNMFAVTGVNIIYIVIETNKNVDILYKKIVPILLSVFKITWANTYIIFMVKFGIRSKLSMHVVLFNYVFALVYLYFVVSVIAVYIRSQECFYYSVGLASIEQVTEIFPSVIPNIQCTCAVTAKNACTQVLCPVDFSSATISQSITFSWIYGYQCGVQILTNYVPAVLSSYTIKGVILPLLKLYVLSFPPRSWLRNNWIVKTMLLPFTANAMTEDDLGKDDDTEFRTLRFLSNLVTDLLMLFTYGILCPFLTFLILWTIAINEMVNHIQIGSYVFDVVRLIDKEEENMMRVTSTTGTGTGMEIGMGLAEISLTNGDSDATKSSINESMSSSSSSSSSRVSPSSPSSSQKSFSVPSTGTVAIGKHTKVEKIDYQFTLITRIYLDNSPDLVMLVWKPMIFTILFFTMLILFDMIADNYDIVSGIVYVAFFWLFVYLLFGSGKTGLDRIMALLKRTRTEDCEVQDVEAADEEELKRHDSKGVVARMSVVEMRSAQENPILNL